MNRLLLTVAAVCLGAAAASAQTQLSGSWTTEPAPKGWAGWTDTGKPNTFTEQPSLTDPPRQRPTNPNVFPTAVFVSLKVEGGKVSGFLGVDTIWDLPMKVELGAIEGNTIRFMTVRPVPNRDSLYWQWIAELKDDNTMVLRRGNIGSYEPGRAGRPNSSNPPPAPAALPALAISPVGALALTLHRVK
jgi:hypothetical protein